MLTQSHSLFLDIQRRSPLRRSVGYLATLAADAMVILLAAWALPYLRLNDVGHPDIFRLVGFLAIVYLFVAVTMGAYDSVAFQRRRAYVGRPGRALLVSYAVLFMAFYLLKAGDQYSRLVVGSMALLTVPGISVVRFAIYPFVHADLNWRTPAEIMVLDGVRDVPSSDAMVVNAADLGITTDLQDIDNLGRIAELGSRFDRVIVLCVPEKRSDWATMLKCLAVRSEICVPELDTLRPLELGETGPYTSLVVSEHPLVWRQAIVKRLFDIAVSAILLLVLSPVLIATAIAIKVDSPGPLLFRQERVGFGNRTFVVLKFRSMRHDLADAKAARLTERNDTRATRVGSFIRRTSIDELPQLFNVLKGEMSIVGPRPHAPAALAGDKLYWEVDENYWHRHIAKPGITGLAQVRGFRGNTFEESDLQSRLDADLEYVANWSLIRDIEIMLATLRVVIHDKAF